MAGFHCTFIALFRIILALSLESARGTPYTSFVISSLPACFITEQSIVEAFTC